MSLRCTVCKSPVDEGLNFCPNCRTGFVSQLECLECGRLVPRGHASCVGCPSTSLAPASPSPAPPRAAEVLAVRSPQHAPPALPGLPPHVSLPAPVASRFVTRQGGVEAEVRVPPGDAEVMDLMGQVVVVLHTLATRMNNLTGHGELTRHVIRSARVLAADVQEELEQRKGPGR